MADIVVNTTDLALRRSRETLLEGFGSLDAKRPTAWAQFGWKLDLCFDDYLRAYTRGGAATGAVHRLLDKCWQELPRIKHPAKDEATPWEESIGELLDDIGGWQKLLDLDRRNMVGRYAALIYRVGDGKQLNEPLVKGSKLVDLVPLWESQIKVLKWNEDATSEDYGKAEMFQIETAPPNERMEQARPRTWIKVHPSRVQILAEGSVGDNFFEGVPLLQAGFNQLIDLEKIGGGSAEGYLKNSARTLVLKFDANGNAAALAATPGEGMPAGPDIKSAIEQKTRDLNRNIDSSIVMQGGDATTLQTTMADPAPAFEVAANLFAASVQIPFTVLFGQQTGRLASDEDKADMVARCKSRQRNVLTPMLTQFIRRMQAIGLIPEQKFAVEWAPLDAPGDIERQDLSGKMVDANLKAFQAGDQPVYTTNEIRKAAGFEALDDGDDMLTPDEKAAADAALQTELMEKQAALKPPAPPPGQQPPKQPGAKPPLQ